MELEVMYPDKNISGAMRLAMRHLRNNNPDMWDGKGAWPKSFNHMTTCYYIDEGHEVRITFVRIKDRQTHNLEWMHRVEYVVCGEISNTIYGKQVNSVESLGNTISQILLDYPMAYLEHFATEAQIHLKIYKPVPVNGTIKYKQMELVSDMSKVAIAAYRKLDASRMFPSLNAELADNEYFGGDNDFHIALTVNSTKGLIPDMPKRIVKWAEECANGETFDSYFKRMVSKMA